MMLQAARGPARATLRVAALAAALGAALTAASPAAADPAAAERLFTQASAAYKRGDFLVAAEAFEAAFREEPAGAALYNAGLSWQAAGEIGRAADDYARALELGGLSARDQADAERRLPALERKLGVLEVRGDPGTRVSIEHAKSRDLPARIHLKPGSHVLRITPADGQLRTDTVRITAGNTTPLDVGTDKPSVRPTAPTPLPPEPAAQSADKPSPALPIAGGISLAAGAGFAVAAIVLGVKALDARDQFDASGQTDADLHDKAASLRTGANVCWVGTGVLAAAGVVMLIVHAASSPREGPVAASTQARLRLTPGGATLDVRF
jgi:hypothetical protein